MSRVLFLKTHVAGYTRKDTGKYVAPHEDKRQPAQIGFEFREPTGGDQVVVFPYASGMSRRRDMAAAIESAAGLGTEIGELSDAGMTRIAEAVADGKPVFVDSGAFNAFKRAMREGTPELSRLDFDRVFAKYNELSRRVREASEADDHPRLRNGMLMMVAPDVIGDQAATLDLIEEHAEQIMSWIEDGHEVIVPFQKGPIDQYRAFMRVHHALDGLPFVVGIPSAAEALSAADLRELLAHDYKPDRIHVLGAVSSRRMEERLAVIRDAYHDDVPGVTADAMVMRSKLHEIGGLAGQEKFDKIKEILNRVVPEMWGGTLSKSFLDGADDDGFFTSAVIFVKADWSARYQRLLERRTGGDPEAMAAEDAKFVDLASSLVRTDEPTPAQAAAGRYPKRAMQWKGLTIRIENEAGSVRRGTKPDGSPWETRMAFPYGEIARTEGVDGDPVDVFIGPLAETADTVFVIHQRRVDDWEHYDEDKCMIGWLTEAEAVAAFLQCYDDPRFLGPVTAMPVAEFIEKAKATRTAPKMIKAELIKGHVGPYIRQGKLVNIHGYDGRAARAEKAPGQGSLFTELEVREAARKKADPERFDHTKTGDLFEQHEDLDSKSAPLVKQTETPQFRAWFGDSKVTRDGEPLRMYHASHRDFDTFDRRKSVEWRRMETMDTVGSWFSDTPSKDGGAGMYADGEGAAIYPVYLSIQKPKFYQTFDEFLNDMHLAAGRDPAKQNPKGRGTTEELREKLKAEGYDGIRFGRTYNRKLWDHAGKLATEVQAAKDAEWAAPRAERPPLTEKRELAEKKLREWRNKLGTNTSTEFDNQEVWIAFEPEQIKSAIGNNGDFSKDSPVITKSILFIKAKARGDDRTADMFGTHLETHARKDGVVQAYHVANAKKDVVIPGHIKQHLDRFVSPAHDAAGALARGRETDKKFRGEGRYAAEVWQDHKPKIEKMHADIEAMLAGIPDEANREAARAHIHGQMPDLSLTDEESGYFRSKKDAALDAAISHLKEDAQQADMPAHEKKEDKALVAKLEVARKSAPQKKEAPSIDNIIAKLNSDDHEGAAELVSRAKSSDLEDLGRRIGFYRKNKEPVTAYKDRLQSIMPDMTKTKRTEASAKKKTWDRLAALAHDYDRMKDWKGAPEGSYDGKWLSHDEAGPHLVSELNKMRSAPHYEEMAAMVRNARPRIFEAASAAPLVKSIRQIT